VRPNRGKVPWWILCESRRVPGTRVWDYLRGVRLAWARPEDTVTALLDRDSVIYQRLWLPLAVSALNTDLDEASAVPLMQVLRETFGRGGAACRPLAPNEGLSESLIDPALERLRAMGGEARLGSRLRAIEAHGERISRLIFDQGEEELDGDAAAVIAVPAPIAARIVPDLAVPDEFRPIVNAHFRVTAPAGTPLFVGVIGGTAQCVFRKREVLSVTISAAGPLVDLPAKDLAQLIWPDVRRAYGLAEGPLPAWQIVKEKRATFAATPAQLSRRPKTQTRWKNLVLAGDWTDTGLPATIEGAIRSGFAAASHLLNAAGVRARRADRETSTRKRRSVLQS
jgi:squalene-associated FAD-dependent desaturase